MTTFAEETVAAIDGRIESARGEMRLLEQARDILSPPEAPRQVRREARREKAKTKHRRPHRATALKLIETTPGISSREMVSRLHAGAYTYELIRRLRDAGEIEEHDGGWHVTEKAAS